MKGSICLVFLFLLMLLVHSKIADIFPKFPLVLELNGTAKQDKYSLASLGSALEKSGKSVLEKKGTFPSKKPETQKEKYLYAFLADLVEDKNLPCIDGPSKPFHQVFKQHTDSLTSFAKILEFLAAEIRNSSDEGANLTHSHVLSRFFVSVLDEIRNLKQLSLEVSRMAVYKKKADISRAKLPTSVRCRYIETRKQVTSEIEKKTESLSTLVELIDGLTDILQSIMQFVTTEPSPVLVSKMKSFKQQMKFSPSKKHSTSDVVAAKKSSINWTKLADNLPQYL